MSDKIGEDYKSWSKEFVILDGGTGCGKSYFCLNILGQYAKNKGKKILYLCNRKELKKQIQERVTTLHLNNISVQTYQYIENRLKSHNPINEKYDYIVSDECHYFTTDSLFNSYTDLSFDYVLNQDQATVIFISATAKVFFNWLKTRGKVSEDRIYKLPNNYDYVEHLYYYKKKELESVINGILINEEDTKIVLFVPSAQRMLEVYNIYKDNADYYCSDNAQASIKKIRTENCIYKKNGLITFNKRLLVTTSVLDNGIDLKDTKIKHIITELFDMDLIVQSLGRKRPISNKDTCNWYVMNRQGQGIQYFINLTQHCIEVATLFKKDRDKFFEEYGDRDNLKKIIRGNNSFYMDENGQLNLNRMVYTKKYIDMDMYKKIKADGFIETLISYYDLSMARKTEQFTCKSQEFLDSLKKFENKNLYAEEQKQIKNLFEDIGLKLRYKGINTFNGALDDKFPKYKPRFSNTDSNGKRLTDKRRLLEDGSINPNRDKRYWILA